MRPPVARPWRCRMAAINRVVEDLPLVADDVDFG